jgi:hypothetical protein
MNKDLVSLLASSDWFDNLLVTVVDEDTLLALNDRELAVLRAHLIREIVASPEITKLLAKKATEIARRLTARAGR